MKNTYALMSAFLVEDCHRLLLIPAMAGESYKKYEVIRTFVRIRPILEIFPDMTGAACPLPHILIQNFIKTGYWILSIYWILTGYYLDYDRIL